MVEKKNRKNIWIKRLGVLLAAIPIIWIFNRLNFSAMLSILPKVAWWTIPVSISAVIICMVLQGIRWWILLRAFIPGLQLRRALAYHFMSVFYGTIIPTGAGQDIIKTLLVARTSDMSNSWAAFWFTRVLSLPAMALVSVYGLLSLRTMLLPKGGEYLLVLMYLAIVALFFFSFSKRFTRPVRIFLTKFASAKILDPLEKVRESIYCYRDHKRLVGLSFLVTVFAQLGMSLGCILTIKGITGTFYLWQCLAFVPLIELLAVAFPLTPNGMGAREALFAALFTYLHLSKEQLGIYVLISLSVTLLPRLIGLLPIMHGFIKKRRLKNKNVTGKEP